MRISNEIGSADGVDPEGLADLPGNLLTDGAVERREERLRFDDRQWLQRKDRQVELELIAGDPDQLGKFGVLRIGVEDLDDSGDVGNHCR